MIQPGDKGTEQFGFTPDKFDGYLWLEGDDMVWVSLIISKEEGKGNLRALFDAIEANGLKIIVPTASNRMTDICKRRGYKPFDIKTPEGIAEIWCKPSTFEEIKNTQ